MFYYFLIGKNSILLLKKEKLMLTMMNTNGPSKRVQTNKDFNRSKEHSISSNERRFHSFQTIHIKQLSIKFHTSKPCFPKQFWISYKTNPRVNKFYLFTYFNIYTFTDIIRLEPMVSILWRFLLSIWSKHQYQ